MNEITLLPGHDKKGETEGVLPLTMKRGELYSVVGDTGSGKSRLIKDIEQLAWGDSASGRFVLLDGACVLAEERLRISSGLMAHLGQSMRFVLDMSVEDFLKLHARCRNKEVSPEAVLGLANDITPEPVDPEQNLNLLSGGQTRALMIADIAMICDSPVVLIDEIENAGIDKEKALKVLLGRDKLVLVVTHDIHTALMAPKRIAMAGGAVRAVLERTEAEESLFRQLSMEYQSRQRKQMILRKGEHLT